MSAGIDEIAACIRAARQAKALTQKELGQRVGLPQSHISKIEKGVVDLQLSSLVQIARALDLEVKLAHRHGVWTYFLLQALRGSAEEALDRDRYLTDRSLRDYLTARVPAFLRKETEIKGLQRPRAIIDSSRTFAIWRVPEILALSANEFSDLRVEPEREYFEAIETGKISSLPGFSKKVHFIPDRVNDAATGLPQDEGTM